MKKQHFSFILFLLAGITFILFSCSKEKIEAEQELEEVSQEENIVDINIKGVEVVDGILFFEDQDALIKARHELAEHNEESIIAWSEKLGFTSLFAEMARIEVLSAEQMQAEVAKESKRQLFQISDEFGDLEFKVHSPINSMVLNAEGIYGIRDYIGTIGFGINVWTKPENKEDLVKVINSQTIEDRSKFIIYDERAFSIERADWFIDQTCPRDALTDFGWTNQFTNPTANRRIKAKTVYDVVISPASGGGNNYDCEYWLYTISYKGPNNKYKTDHYMSLDVDVVPFFGIPQGWVSNRANTDIDTRTKYGTIVNHIERFRGVSTNFLQTNGMRLVETHPGSDGGNMTGTAGSHRGMGGRYIRFDCD